MSKLIVSAAVAIVAAASFSYGVLIEKAVARKRRLEEVEKLENRIKKVETFLASVKEETEGSQKCRKDLALAISYATEYVNDAKAGGFFYSEVLSYLDMTEDYMQEILLQSVSVE